MKYSNIFFLTLTVLMSLSPAVVFAGVENVTLYTASAANIKAHSAIINGVVKGDSTQQPLSTPINVWFVYGTSPQNLNMATEVTPTYSVNKSVSVAIGNLSSNTKYYYKIVAIGPFGEKSGEIKSFTTADGGNILQQGEAYSTTQVGDDTTQARTPQQASKTITAITIYAKNITQTSAQLQGDIYIRTAMPTVAWFEVGEDPNTFTRITTKQHINATQQQTTLIHKITGLKPGTRYYFRIAAKSDNATTYGNVLSFTTKVQDVANTSLVQKYKQTASVINTQKTNRAIKKQNHNGAEKNTESYCDKTFLPLSLSDWLIVVAAILTSIASGNYIYRLLKERSAQKNKREDEEEED